RPLLHGTVREVAAHERALHAAPHRLAHDQHLVERDFRRVRPAPEVGADRIADGHQVHARAIGDLGDLVVPRHDADDLATVGFHRLEIGEGYSHARLSTVFSKVAPGTVMFHFTVQLYSSSKRSRVYGVGGPCSRRHDWKSRSSMRPPVSATKYLMNGPGSFSS